MASRSAVLDTQDSETPLTKSEELSADLPHVRLRPSKGWVSLNLGDLWEYRELLYFLTWRDIKVRYKQTALGALWAVVQPFMTMVAFSIFFGNLGKIPSDGLPYPVFTFAGLLPWSLFTYALGQASGSLVSSSNLITKVYFPRLVIPISSVLSGVLDFAVAFAVFLCLLAYFHITPSIAVVLLPLFVLLTLTTALGVGMWLSALNVEYRDVRYAIPFVTQFWLFATPIAYPSSLLDEPWRTIYGLNPMVGVVEGFRWTLLHTEPPAATLAISSLISIALLVSGTLYFRRMERTFADLV